MPFISLMSKEAFELIIHARAGQGAKSAAEFIAEAALYKGKHIQAWPNYGAERSGAPMMAFARISNKQITTHEPIRQADAMLILDPTLMEKIDVNNELSKDGLLIANLCDIGLIKAKTKYKGKVLGVDGTGISRNLLGKDFPNVPLIGALVAATNIVELNALILVIRKHFQKKIGEGMTDLNIRALREGYEKAK